MLSFPLLLEVSFSSHAQNPSHLQVEKPVERMAAELAVAKFLGLKSLRGNLIFGIFFFFFLTWQAGLQLNKLWNRIHVINVLKRGMVQKVNIIVARTRSYYVHFHTKYLKTATAEPLS